MIPRTLLLLTGSLLSVTSSGLAQNLVVNPGAETGPGAAGWSILSVASACAAGTAASTSYNWTMVPDNSANYPRARTGSRTFMAGCSNVVNSSFEVYQDIDVTADASHIDAGQIAFEFSGYMQTPLVGQGDAARMTVDYLNAADVVLGTSYTVSQSNAAGSGITWNHYTNTRTAPTGTRKVRIRLRATVVVIPAINAYFDDISLVKNYLVALPVTLSSFTVAAQSNTVVLNWDMGSVSNLNRFEVERSSDHQNFTTIGTVQYKTGTIQYQFTDKEPAAEATRYYRLKMSDADGKPAYSRILSIKANTAGKLVLMPNPALGGDVVIKGITAPGTVTISTITGLPIQQFAVQGQTTIQINLSQLPKGAYLVTYRNSEGVFTSKLMVQ